MTVRRSCQQPFFNYFRARLRHPFTPYRDPASWLERGGPFAHLHCGMVQALGALGRPHTSTGARTFLSNVARNWHWFWRIVLGPPPWNLGAWRNLFGRDGWRVVRRGEAYAVWAGGLWRGGLRVVPRT